MKRFDTITFLSKKNMTEKPGRKEISAMLNNFVEVLSPKSLSQFCVDGRKSGKPGLYLQALGGSYHLVTLNWLLTSGKASEYKDVQQETFSVLRKKGYRLGVHQGHHAEGEESDCGFADNNGKIIKTLAERADEIWGLITQAEPILIRETSTWKEVKKLVSKAEIEQIPSGKDLITQAVSGYQADLQTLEGDHKEIAAVVNLRKNTTLNVDKNQETQAFNLDLWHVIDQVKDLGLNEKKSSLLSLGLYVATEMVLVENKNKPRLPIIIRK